MSKAFNIFNSFMTPPGKLVDGQNQIYFFNNGDVSRFDFPLPEVLERAIRSKLDSRKYGYSRPQGNDGICKKIAQFERQRSGNQVSKSNIVLTTGVTNGLDLVFDTLNLQGDIIIPVPTYPIGEALAERHKLSTVKIPTKPENNYLPNSSDISNVISDSTSAVLLTSPNNPTGSEFSQEEMQKISELCKDKGIYLIVDEIFSNLMLDDNSHPISSYDIDFDPIIRINGWSKDRGVAGFRLGYIVASADVAKNIGDNISLRYGNAPTVYNNFISKDMSLRKYQLDPENVPESMREDLEEYDEVIGANLARYNSSNHMIEGALSDVSRIKSVSDTQGGYCKFIQFDGVENDIEFLTDLYVNSGVVLVPGSAFSSQEPGWARLTFSVSPARLEQGLESMVRYLKN